MKKFQPLMVAAGLLCIATPSFAGSWGLDAFESEGTAQTVDHPASYSWLEDDIAQDIGDNWHAVMQSPPTIVASQHFAASGWVRAVISWHPAFVGDTPPEIATFWVRSRSSVDWSASQNNMSATVSNSDGGPIQEYEEGGYKTKRTVGYRLVQVATASGEI